MKGDKRMRTEKIVKIFSGNNMKEGVRFAGIMLVAVLSFGLGTYAASRVGAQQLGTSLTPASSAPSANIIGSRSSYADIVDRVGPAVVAVRSERRVRTSQQMDDPSFRQFFGDRAPREQSQPQIERGVGSGVIVSSDGTILTNDHVVDGAQQIKVELPDKRTLDAKVVGTDKPSDLAVLKVNANNLPVLPLGDSDKVRVGDVVLAVGNPLGLEQTVTAGIISAKGRSTGLSDGSFEDFLQTDAPINQGNSGGALVNTNGALVGINSQILSPSGGSIGIGFAIPSNMAKNVMDQLLKTGKVHRGQLGVGIQSVTSDIAASLGLKNVQGVIVNSVTPNSPADRAGLRQGDIITALNGSTVVDSNELRNKVADTAPGTEVTLTILRDGGEQQMRAALGEVKANTAKNESGTNDNGGGSTEGGALGLGVQPLTPELSTQLNLRDATGLAVTSVDPTGAGAEAGIKQGDVIEQINRQPVHTAADVRTALQRSGSRPALLLVDREGQSFYVAVQPLQG